MLQLMHTLQKDAVKRFALKYTHTLQFAAYCGVIGVNIKEVLELNLVNILYASTDMQKNIMQLQLKR